MTIRRRWRTGVGRSTIVVVIPTATRRAFNELVELTTIQADASALRAVVHSMPWRSVICNAIEQWGQFMVNS
jgi:hypothetical protein